MIYTPDDITPVDAFDHIRQAPHRFFRGGTYDPAEACAMLVGEALAAGAEDVHVLAPPGWFVVTAERDWIGALESAIFHNIVPVPGVSNSMFAEVLLTAFARHVITATPDHTTTVKGCDICPLDLPRSWARTVASPRPEID